MIALSSVAFAQNNADIAANASVQSPITVDSGNDLEFGDVFPGVAKSVARTDAEAGSFTISGQASTTVFLNFDLPTTLVDGANNLPIAFSDTDAGRNTANTQGSATSFDPNVETSTALSAGGDLYVWIGGTVTPSIAQVAGTYTADITLTVTYD